MWLNDGAGRFRDVTRAVGAVNQYDGRAVAFADLWNRGVLDAVVAYQRGPLLVYKNTVTPRHGWIAFTLQGRRSNRSAIGAEIHLYWAGMEHGAGSADRGWQRVRRAEPTPGAFRAGRGIAGRQCRDPLAVRRRTDTARTRHQQASRAHGA